MFVEIEDSHQVVFFAGEESTMVFGVECHAMITTAAADWISPHNQIRGWIYHCKNIFILQVHV